MYTNQMRFTGMSGVDTDSMVQQLMYAEGMKMTKLKQQRQLLSWKQEAYHSTADTLKAFQSSFLNLANISNSFRSASNYKNMATSVKLSGVEDKSITAKAASTAKTGDYSLTVNQVAKKDTYVSSSSAGSGIAFSESISLDNISSSDTFTFTLDSGTKKAISFSTTELQTLKSSGNPNEAFADALNDKLKAAFGTETINGVTNQKAHASLSSNGTLVINAQSGHSLSLAQSDSVSKLGYTTSDSLSTATSTSMSIESWFKNNPDVLQNGNRISFNINGYDFSFDKSDSMDKVMQAVNSSDAGVNLSYNNLTGAFKLEASETGLAGKISFSDKAGGFLSSGLKFGTTGASMKSDSLGSAVNLDASLESIFGSEAFESGSATFKINGKDFEVTGNTSVSEFMDKINNSDAGVTISLDASSNSFVLNSKNPSAQTIEISGSLMEDVFNFTENANSAYTTPAQDAIFTFDGMTTTRSSNTFTLSDITFTLTGDSEGKTLSVNVGTDTSKTLETVKKFIDEYNKLIESINTTTTTARPTSGKYTHYEPLTDEQRSAMSEKDVELWEEKAKSGLLYNDSILKSIAQEMRTMLYKSVETDDGGKIALFSIGITTSGKMGDYGKLIIKDEDVLLKAIEERGDDIAALFTKGSNIPFKDTANRAQRMNEEGLAERLNDIIEKAIGGTSGSKGTIGQKAGINGSQSYTDNEIYSALNKMDDKISNMLTYLQNKETYYYNMFSRMEAAMTQSNSQMSALQGML